MRDWAAEAEEREGFIRDVLKRSGAKGVVFGNSGGKDCALAGILCKRACENTVGVIMPSGSKRNYGEDLADAAALAAQYGIESRTVDLSAAADAMKRALGGAAELTDAAAANISPRLRMTTLYAIAASEGRLVAGTGNRSERHMGYFTKWGDGAYDFNAIADLTVSEVYAFLEYLGAPRRIIDKAPSAGLFDGQTDEGDMGVTYASIDALLLTGNCPPEDLEIIAGYHKNSMHKRLPPAVFGDA